MPASAWSRRDAESPQSSTQDERPSGNVRSLGAPAESVKVLQAAHRPPRRLPPATLLSGPPVGPGRGKGSGSQARRPAVFKNSQGYCTPASKKC